MGGKSNNRMTSDEYRAMVSKAAAPITEKCIERAILEYLELVGITAWKQNNGCLKAGNRFVKFFMDSRGNSIRGIPDIAGWLSDGRALYIEVKRPGKYPSPEQKAFLQNATDSGCVAFVARSVDDVISHLSNLGYKLTQ